MGTGTTRVASNIILIVLTFLLCISAPFKLMRNLDFSLFEKLRATMDGHLSLVDTLSGGLDFGRIYHNHPSAILQPASARDIAVLLRAIYASSDPYNLTVAAKGAGHSTHGQAQAPNGVVIEMRSLRGIDVHVTEEFSYADVSAGELWVDLLRETMKVNLAPRSWTDYLYLSVGGTLSNAGISGQTFRHGPQISNVLQLDLVTGTGEAATCSPTENADLFYAAMGGLGQFGIITRARIILEPAPQKVRWVRAFYDDFQHFTRDQEHLISMQGSADAVDYVEGFIVQNSEAIMSSSWSAVFPSIAALNGSSSLHQSGNKIYYCIEIAKYLYAATSDGTGDADEAMGNLLTRLSYIPSLIYSVETSYFDFLNRVQAEELNLRSRGLWNVPHPWLNMFVPRTNIRRFTDFLLKTIFDPCGAKGPILLYPVNRSKWDANMSAVIPENEEEIFYVVGLLRSANPDCSDGSSCLQNLLLQNQQIIDFATADTADGSGMGAKQYLSYYSYELQWKNHFGSKWRRFLDRKAKFDPLNILSPGQRILDRKVISRAANYGQLQ